MKRMRFFLLVFIIILGGIAVNAQVEVDRPLRELATDRERFFGAAVMAYLIQQNPTYAETLSREFSMLTPENDAKMCEIQPRRGVFDFNNTDYLVHFAEAHGMQVRGHTLVWHQCFPDWLNPTQYTREEAIGLLRDHIYTVAGRYKGRIYAWDVVNEGINDSGQIRDTQWRRMIGDDYMDLAFQFARDADPDALLFYNDYNAEDMGRKSQAVYDLVSGMIERGIPIDGVGMQMHFSIGQVTNRDSRAGSAIRENMERLAALGLDIHITELDLRHTGAPEDWVMTRQAQNYRAITEICLSVEACKAIVLWGFTDAHSWVPDFFENPQAAPLIFDRNYQPKPAYFALAEAFAHFQPED